MREQRAWNRRCHLDRHVRCACTWSLVTALQVKAACNKPGLVPKLEIIVVELEKCKKSLSEYLR